MSPREPAAKTGKSRASVGPLTDEAGLRHLKVVELDAERLRERAKAGARFSAAGAAADSPWGCSLNAEVDVDVPAPRDDEKGRRRHSSLRPVIIDNDVAATAPHAAPGEGVARVSTGTVTVRAHPSRPKPTWRTRAIARGTVRSW